MRDVYEEDYIEETLDFGHRLLALLDKEKISQNKLAVAADIDISSISEYINHGKKPTYYNIKKLAICLGCSTDYLLGMEEKK